MQLEPERPAGARTTGRTLNGRKISPATNELLCGKPGVRE